MTWIMHESRWPQMRGAEGEAVLVALRTLRNEADAGISARPDSQGSCGTCFGSQGEQSIARRVNTHIFYVIQNNINIGILKYL